MEADKLTLKAQTVYVLIIPALNPDGKLSQLVKEVSLGQPLMKTLVIDDGSSPAFLPQFAELKGEENCIVIHHSKNLGKGAALKTGIKYIMKCFPDCAGIITADSDGQHSSVDISRIALAITEHPNSLILGTRDFSSENVPFKSRWGNQITSKIFKLVTGRACSDTQTGLRCIAYKNSLSAINVIGERYEYEMNLLLQFAGWHIPLVELPIETIYLNENKGSHFRPIHDSARIYGVIFRYWLTSLFRGTEKQSPLRFLVASLLSFVIDMSLFMAIKMIFAQKMAFAIVGATIVSRLISGIFNFTINRKWVFRSQGNTGQKALGYLLLFTVQMVLSGLLVSILSLAPVPLLMVKLVVDFTLFLASYQIQRRFVFKKARKTEGGRL